MCLSPVGLHISVCTHLLSLIGCTIVAHGPLHTPNLRWSYVCTSSKGMQLFDPALAHDSTLLSLVQHMWHDLISLLNIQDMIVV